METPYVMAIGATETRYWRCGPRGIDKTGMSGAWIRHTFPPLQRWPDR